MHDQRNPAVVDGSFVASLVGMHENGLWKRHRWVEGALTLARVLLALETTTGTFRNCVEGTRWT